MRHDPSITTESGGLASDEPQEEQVLQDYRQRYGLSIDPFGADPYFPLFTGGQRRELLDQVIHCCEFSASVPVVLGERGVGKTRIACAFYEALGDGRSCLIAALPTLDAQGLIGEIAQYFAIGDPTGTTAHYIDALRAFGDVNDDGLALVLIDDAHHLDDPTLAVLLELLQGRAPGEPGLQVVLFGDLTLVARLHQLGNQSLPITDFYLERFSLTETVDYLNFRMEMADYLGSEMFTEAMVEPWWRRAQGQLPVIHRYAQEHLLEAVLPPISGSSRPFPILHIVAIAALGAAVLMTLLYRGDKSEIPAEVQRVPINLQPPPVATSIPVQSETVGQIMSEDEMDISAIPVAQQGDSIAGESERVAEVTPSAAGTNINESAWRVTSQTLEPEVIREAAVAADAPAARPAQAPAPVPVVARRLSSDEETLLSWRPSDFTLQLLGVSTEKAARDYIASQSNRDDLLMFKTVRQGKDWFVVVGGRYESSVVARGAIKELPQEQIKAGPWPRELKIIQQEIRR